MSFLPNRKASWFWWCVGLFAFLVFVLEFSIDITTISFLHWTLWSIDLIIISGFIIYVFQKAFDWKGSWFDFVANQRMNLIFFVFVILSIHSPRFAAFLVIIRLMAVGIFRLLDTPFGKAIASQIQLRPSQTLTLSFALLIALSTTLLMFPASTQDGLGAPFLDAFFTATSAACVVGLVVVDTGSYYSSFGQAVILFTIQLGGLGIMVLSAAFAILMGAKLRTRQTRGLSEILDVGSEESLKSLIHAIVTNTILIELSGTLLLFAFWEQPFSSFGNRFWWSLFHSISAFCNAGFGLAKNNLIDFAENTSLCLTIAALIVLGGLGFSVLADVTSARAWQVKKPSAIWSRLQLQTKVVLVMTLLLNLIGMLVFLFLEYNHSLASLSISGKLTAALFQPISMRTAGYNSVHIAHFAAPTVLFSVVWMFIGGSPGSTSGGIKTTTTAIAFTAFRAMLLGREEVELLGRRIPHIVVNRSLSLIFISILFVILVLMFLVGTQPIAFERLLFETISAFGTVGLSMDVTSQLNPFGKLLVILLMYIGRVGPLTLALAIGERIQSSQHRFPKGQIAVG